MILLKEIQVLYCKVIVKEKKWMELLLKEKHKNNKEIL
jgi:hypothetical protein